MQITIHGATKAAALFLVVLLGGCAANTASKYTLDVVHQKANYAPKPNQALVVFMRPTGGRASPPIYDVTDGQTEFVGIVSPKSKMAHYAKPGKRLFMVLSESTNLMVADLAPGKVYYALVEPNMGWVRPRYSLDPVPGTQVNTSEFADWYTSTRWVEVSPVASDWARRHELSARTNLTKYLPEWDNRTDKPVLNLVDGQTSLFRAPYKN